MDRPMDTKFKVCYAAQSRGQGQHIDEPQT